MPVRPMRKFRKLEQQNSTHLRLLRQHQITQRRSPQNRPIMRSWAWPIFQADSGEALYSHRRPVDDVVLRPRCSSGYCVCAYRQEMRSGYRRRQTESFSGAYQLPSARPRTYNTRRVVVRSLDWQSGCALNSEMFASFQDRDRILSTPQLRCAAEAGLREGIPCYGWVDTEPMRSKRLLVANRIPPADCFGGVRC